MIIFFAMQKLFSFMHSHLSVLSLRWWAIRALFIKLLPISMWSNVFSTLSWGNFTVSDPTH
jgi:hypothetical protein